MVVLRSGTAEQDDVGGLGHRIDDVAGVDDVDVGHVLADVAAVDQEATRTRIAVPHVFGRQHRGGDHLVGGDVHPRLGEQARDLATGAGRGVGEVGPRNLIVGEHPQRLRGAGDGLPRGHQDAIDVEQHSTDSHAADSKRQTSQRNSGPHQVVSPVIVGHPR